MNFTNITMFTDEEIDSMSESELDVNISRLRNEINKNIIVTIDKLYKDRVIH